MAKQIRTSVSNTHPVKVSRWGLEVGKPLRCDAQVLVVMGMDRNKIAVSMNGTAVFTKDEFRQWVSTILGEE